MNSCPTRSASGIAARICWTVRGGAEVGGVDAAEPADGDVLGVRDVLGGVAGAVDSTGDVVGVVVVIGAVGPPPDVHPASAPTITTAATPMDLIRPLSQPVGPLCAVLVLCSH
jgi:hypothetical protein